MSLEDLDSEFKSDESDYEAEKNAEDDSECSYSDLYDLHLNLRRFQQIYSNNDIIDMESMQSEAGPRFDFESMLSEMQSIDLHEDSHVQDFIQIYEEMASTASSPSSSSPSSSSSSSSNSNLIVASDVTDG